MKHVIELDEEQEENLKDYIDSLKKRDVAELNEEQALSIIIELGFEELGYR